MSSRCDDRRNIMFQSAVGSFFYVPDEMQLYPRIDTLPQWNKPLLTGRRVDLIEPDYAKATISVVTGCNLGCSYCLYGALSRTGMRMMTPETGRAIIDYLCGTFGGTTKRITLSLTSNGEPTLNLGTIEAIKTYCRTKTAEGGPEFRFNFSTNAILLTTETLERYLVEKDQDVFFSIDGPPHLHDCLRITRSGVGSYNKTADKIAFYRERYEQYDKGFSSSTVLTARDERFDKILIHLDDLGLEYIVMRPIRGAKDGDFALNENTLPIFKRGYARMLDLIEERAVAGDLGLLHKVCNRYDFFGRLFSALLLGEERVQGCPGCPPKHSDISRYSLVFDTDGKVYFPCRDFIGREEYCLGSVFSKVDLGRVREVMRRIHAPGRPICQACWARTMCGGSCYNAALAATGTIEEPDQDLCELTRYLAERAVQLAHALVTRHPQAIEMLTQRAISVSPWVREQEAEEAPA